MGEPEIQEGQLDFVIDEAGPPLIAGQGETEDELDSYDAQKFQAAVSATDWTVETIVGQMRKGRIDLNPRFQRRNAWLGERKSRLIESMILRYPIPQLVLAEFPGRPGNYFVIDGKQRLLALRQFCFDPDDPRDEGFEPLRLTGLDLMKSLNGMHWRDVQSRMPELAATFENHTIRTVFLSHWQSNDLLLSLFLRLNTGSVSLSPQELRQALLPGPFVEWIDLKSGQSSGLRRLLGNSQPDRRMIDAELLLRFIAFNRPRVQYRGNLKKFLDDTCESFNGDWDNAQADAEDGLATLELSIDTAFAIFGPSGVCRKWSGRDFERPLNRALFDVEMAGFAYDPVRQAAMAQGPALVAQFQALCTDDDDFLRSITATTKTADAFRTRMNAWRRAVRDVTGVDFPLPEPLSSIWS